MCRLSCIRKHPWNPVLFLIFLSHCRFVYLHEVVLFFYNAQLNSEKTGIIEAFSWLFVDGKPMLRLGDTGDWVGKWIFVNFIEVLQCFGIIFIFCIVIFKGTFEGHKGAVWGVALNRMATLAASGAADFSAKIWDSVSGEEKLNFQHNHIVKSVAFDEASIHLLTGNNEKLLRVFDVNQPSTNPAIEMYAGHSGAIRRALFCRNDKCIVSCAEDKAVKIWDRSTGSEVQEVEFATNPSSIEISRDGTILTVTNGSNVSFFEMETLKKIREITIPTKLAAASLHPDKLGKKIETKTCKFILNSHFSSFCLRRRRF